MAFDWQSALYGAGGMLILIIFGILFVLSLILGRVRTEIKFILNKIYSRLSLMIIAIMDVVVAFDPSQTFLGLAAAPVLGAIVFLCEWILHDKMEMAKIFPALVAGVIAAFIIMLPFPIAGLFVAWYGVVGDKRKSA